jgi:arabinan endo-1,5-alpha-L-arabinosidase
VEAPTLVRRGATYVLLYSANSYGGDDYAVGYATARRLEGPYDKAPSRCCRRRAPGGRTWGPAGRTS